MGKVLEFKSLKVLNNRLIKSAAAESMFKDETIVTGVGPQDSKLMIVGEAPGRHEVQFGVPFIGRAGSFFTNILKEELGLDRDDYYISNIVKIWPHLKTERGRTRPPSKEEIEYFLPYIREEIELIKPKVILAVGKVAYKHLTGLDDFSPGIVKEYSDDTKIMPLYHPAYMLRKQKMMSELRENLNKSLKRVKDILG